MLVLMKMDTLHRHSFGYGLMELVQQSKGKLNRIAYKQMDIRVLDLLLFDCWLEIGNLCLCQCLCLCQNSLYFWRQPLFIPKQNHWNMKLHQQQSKDRPQANVSLQAHPKQTTIPTRQPPKPTTPTKSTKEAHNISPYIPFSSSSHKNSLGRFINLQCVGFSTPSNFCYHFAQLFYYHSNSIDCFCCN